MKDIETKLADKYARENFEKIKEMTGNVDSADGGVISASLWNRKKQLFPQSRDPSTAMIDPRNGNLLTTDDKIKHALLIFLYKHYQFLFC